MLLASISGIQQSEPVVDLSTNGTANCYIVSEPGTYSLPAVMGNSSRTVGQVSSAGVLWETFCTGSAPEAGELISNVQCRQNRIIFETSRAFKRGNALIAAFDAYGTILWSWHIWLTDQPKEQEYYNNAGIMMDKDLGAQSGRIGENREGLTYQWGRKDPFTGYEVAATDGKEWELYDYEIATPKYATAHPTTVIRTRLGEYQCVHHGIWCRDEDLILWDRPKTIYDPCPPGWRIPDSGIWDKANPTYSQSFDRGDTPSNIDHQFGKIIGQDSNILYPHNHYWSNQPYRYECFHAWGYEMVDWCDDCDAISDRAYVRCQKE